METLGILLLFVAVIVVASLYTNWMNKRKTKAWLEDQYGKEPHIKETDIEDIAVYWEENKEGYKDKIDEITWNDLGLTDIFRRVNSCCSFVGEQILYGVLHCFPTRTSYGTELEKKITYFATHKEERIATQLHLMSLGKKEGNYSIPFIVNNLEVFEMDLVWLYKIMQILLVGSVIPAIILQNFNFLGITLAIFSINLILYSQRKSQYEIHLASLNSMIQIVRLGVTLEESELLGKKDKVISLTPLLDPFRKLNKIVGKLQMKKASSYSGDIFALINDYLIGATLWEFTNYNKVLEGLKGKEEQYLTLYRVIGELDMAIAIASFRESIPEYCIPEFDEDKSIVMEEVYHPLTKNPVCNSITLDHNCIITGSNASGKSTFIKCVAVNVLLGQSIHTCMAKRMVYPFAKVITSMAVTDDLMAGESYYIKEIKYLHRIIESLSNDQFVICVIDEILRGTNTEERISASTAILQYLQDKNCLAIVASHDHELTELLAKTYKNYHFREQIINNDIYFDYKIHNGPSTTKNAIRLLEYIGFPKEIITNAKHMKY